MLLVQHSGTFVSVFVTPRPSFSTGTLCSTHTLSHSLTPTYTLFPSLSHSHAISYISTHTHTHTHIHTHTHDHTPTNTHTRTHTHTLVAVSWSLSLSTSSPSPCPSRIACCRPMYAMMWYHCMAMQRYCFMLYKAQKWASDTYCIALIDEDAVILPFWLLLPCAYM